MSVGVRVQNEGVGFLGFSILGIRVKGYWRGLGCSLGMRV